MDLLREELDNSDWIEGIRFTADFHLRGLEVSGIFGPLRQHVKPLLSLDAGVCHFAPKETGAALSVGGVKKEEGCVQKPELALRRLASSTGLLASTPSPGIG